MEKIKFDIGGVIIEMDKEEASKAFEAGTIELHSDELVVYKSDDFETFKDILRGLWKSGKYKNDNVSDWEEWEDIPKKEIMKLLQIV